MFLKNFKNKKAESLVELVMAIWILALVLIWIMKVLWNAKISAEWAEKRMQAVSLAREWIEMFRYVRELNYMRYSDKKRICWNFLADNQSGWAWDWMLNWSDTICNESWTSSWSANYIFQDDHYYIPLQNMIDESTARYFLHWTPVTTTDWNTRMSTWAFLAWAWLSDFRLCKYTPNWLITSCKSPPSWTVPTDFEEIPFIRWLKVDYVNVFWQLCRNNPTNDPCSLLDPQTLNHIKVTSIIYRVSWTNLESVELITIFSDHEDRIDRWG